MWNILCLIGLAQRLTIYVTLFLLREGPMHMGIHSLVLPLEEAIEIFQFLEEVGILAFQSFVPVDNLLSNTIFSLLGELEAEKLDQLVSEVLDDVEAGVSFTIHDHDADEVAWILAAGLEEVPKGRGESGEVDHKLLGIK